MSNTDHTKNKVKLCAGEGLADPDMIFIILLILVHIVSCFCLSEHLQLFVGGLMPYLRYLCLLAYSGVQHISGCVAFCFVFLRLVYPMLPVSLDCSFAIALSVFSDVYLTCVGLSIQRNWQHRVHKTKKNKTKRNTTRYVLDTTIRQ
jgi:hypothetical protein